ncbi:hypothetical protein llap_15746 [Limosa lapponica baueri]|uniref:Uncharacterized protein n=1 Tax=Limosa lapponica baueri TaxID=1758121 RepID=A0A2I0TJI3_LIMLA|nr:hypothetical protein llap_15746 [Limosa lapponica baueri]
MRATLSTLLEPHSPASSSDEVLEVDGAQQEEQKDGGRAKPLQGWWQEHIRFFRSTFLNRAGLSPPGYPALPSQTQGRDSPPALAGKVQELLLPGGDENDTPMVRGTASPNSWGSPKGHMAPQSLATAVPSGSNQPVLERTYLL